MMMTNDHNQKVTLARDKKSNPSGIVWQAFTKEENYWSIKQLISEVYNRS